MTAVEAVVVAYAVGLAIIGGYAAVLVFMSASIARRERAMNRRNAETDVLMQ